jgi:hypothetical protein
MARKKATQPLFPKKTAQRVASVNKLTACVDGNEKDEEQ